MQVNVTSLDGAAVKPIILADEVFDVDFNESLIHQIVTADMAKKRAGTKAQKTRAQVRGGGCKPWRQKGTGRARAGTIRSPLWRKGGVSFAASNRDYTKKVNKKMYRLAMRSIVSELLKQERVTVVDDIAVQEPKTKLLVALLGKLNLDKVLIVVDEMEPKLALAARNIANVRLVTVDQLNSVLLVGCDQVLFTVAAIKQLEEAMA